MTLALTFHGGAHTVTGSRFELEANGRHFLFDCGMFQGLRQLRDLNWEPPAFDAASLEAVFITHAHIDHTGYLPRLVKEGFRGPIYATPATVELAHILLMDAAKIQEEDAAFANRKGFSKHKPAKPLFDQNDAQQALSRMKPVDYAEWLTVGPLRVRFHQAGHILGSAVIEVDADTGEGRSTLVFSGDLGREAQPLHVDPDARPVCDTLVLESTYGDRSHDSPPLAAQLREPFERAIARRGTILVPAFAVARAQMLTLTLRELMDKGELPTVPIHIDSPMAVDVTGIYDQYIGTPDLDPLPGRHRVELFPKHVQFHRSVEESRKLNDMPGPRIIVSASGMLSGGRVLHHLARLAPDPNALIVLAGFQAAGTRGRALAEGAKTVRVHGRDIPLKAQIMELEGLSAHADGDFLEQWALAGRPPKTVFLTHGEPKSIETMERRLEARHVSAIGPMMGQRFEYIPASGHWRQVAAPKPPKERRTPTDASRPQNQRRNQGRR